jgi:anthraniloyl-CoA monooxygenase
VRDQGFPIDLDHPPVPMFTPFRLRDMVVENRVVVSPMDQYSAVDGVPGDWHFVHLGSRAAGGAGLVYVEMTCPSPEARISPGDTGLWNETQRDAFKRIVDFCHANSRAKMCMQLGHSGRKGSTQLGWERMDHPLESGNWPVARAWTRSSRISKEAPRLQIKRASTCWKSTWPTAISSPASSLR